MAVVGIAHQLAADTEVGGPVGALRRGGGDRIHPRQCTVRQVGEDVQRIGQRPVELGRNNRSGETVQFVDRADVGLVASAGIGKRFSHIVEARLERTVHGAVAGTFAGQDVDQVAQVGPRVADAVGILADEFGIAQPAPVEVVAESRDGCIEANDRPVDSTAEALAATRSKTNGEQRDSKQGGGSCHGSVHQSSLQSAEAGRSTPRTATVDPGTARAMASAARSASQSPHMNTSKAA